jgi:NAD(P)-dependent dehydrogenase (short-subunit alcohol dehydrogenase family)
LVHSAFHRTGRCRPAPEICFVGALAAPIVPELSASQAIVADSRSIRTPDAPSERCRREYHLRTAGGGAVQRRPPGTTAAMSTRQGRLSTVRLADKVTIITGAGGGMGRTAARMFAAEGAKVVCVDVSEEMAESAAGDVKAAGGQATAVAADVSKEDQAKKMVDHAVATFGRVDALYNNAGIMPAADHSVIDTDVATWDKVMAVNVRGVFLGCKYAIPKMVDQGSGSVINVASFVAILGCSVPQDAYTASKGAVLALTKSLAVQFAPQGVRTNSISPGPIETPLLMDWLVKDEEAKKIRLARNPTGRFGKPEEIVHVALYLASDESRWTNGANLVIDGGITVNYF